MADDSTMKFKADISQLKAAMQQASRAIKLANSEFKAASAGLDDWNSSAEGVESKLKQLTTVLKAQKTQLSLMDQELEKTAAAYGENSAEADRVRIKINNQKAAIANTEKQISSYTKKLEDVKNAAEDVGELSAFDKQKQSVNQMEKELESLKRAYASLQLEERDTTEESEQLAREIKELSAELKKSKTNLDSAENAADELDETLEDTGNSAERASDGFTVMKGALANLVADGFRLAIRAAKDLATETFNAGANFESAMSQVAAVSGASAEDIDKLTAKAKEMGESTKFSASESAEAFNYMAMAGWKTEDMIDGISGIMNLAAASGEDLATTSDIVTDALTAMGYKASDSGKLADVMAAASSNANTNVAMMGQTFQYAAPIVGALGYSMEDTAVAIGLMANAGIKGDKAGTALRSTLTRLSAPPKECAEAMEELGVSITDDEGKMKPLSKVMEELRGKFAGLSETQQTQYAKALAGQEAMSGLLAIVNAAPDDFEKLTKAVKESNGAAEEMADTMNDNVSGQITLLKSKIEGVMIKVFEKAAPKIRKAIDSVSSATDAINWDSVAKKVGDFGEQAVNLFKYILQNGNTIIRIVKTLGIAFTTIFVVNKIATFKNSLLTLIPALTKLTAGTGAATTATTLLGAAQTALPLVALATGVMAVVGAIGYYVAKADEAALAEYSLNEEQKETIDNIERERKAIDELNKTRDEQIANANGEFSYIEKLKDEYNGLIDSNGKVKKGYEDRAEFILTTLANSLGVERSEIEKLIGKNGELGKSIDKLIEKQRAQAVLNAYEESYNNAVKNRETAIQAYGNALKTLDETEAKYNSTKDQAAAVMEKYNELLAVSPEAAYAYYSANQQLVAANEEAKKSYEAAQQAVTDAKQNYIDYNTTIENYEGLSSALISGKTKEIEKALANMQTSFVSSKNGTKEILEQQVKDFESKYYALKAAVDNGMPNVTQAEVDAAKKMVDQAKAELDKLEPKAQASGKEAGKAHADGIASNAEAGKKAGEKVAKAATTGAKTGGKDAKKTGETAGAEYAKGIESAKSKGKKAGETLSKDVDSGVKKGGKDSKKTGTETGDQFVKGIDSKKDAAKTAGEGLGKQANTGENAYRDDSRQSGVYFGQGYINGINSKQIEAYNAGYQLGKKAHAGMKAGQKEGSPSKLTYQSGVYFVQGYINGIISEQKVLNKTVKSMVTNVIGELGKMTGFNFSDVAKNASTKFADTMNAQASYMLAKLQYQNEAKIKDFDNTITKLEKERDKKVAALEKKQTKKNKASIQKQINAVKNQYTKLINEQNKYKTAYQTASSKMISEFQTAINQYQNAAKQLIDDTINGITDKYNTRYNELISKQDNLINKLKSAGSLFEVSNAGIMTVNDIKEQTKQIQDYTAKLAKIKEKVSSELFDEIAGYDMKEGGAFIDRLLEMNASDLDAYNKAYTEKIEAASKAAEGIYKSDFDKVAKDYEKEINSAFKGIDKQLEALGNEAMKGFVNGLTKNTDYLDSNVKTFVKSMIDTFKKELKIKSPSKVMFGLGEYTGEGFDDGLMSMIKDIQKTAGRIANSITSPLDTVTADISGVRSSVRGGNGLGVGNSNVVNNYNLVQNNNSPKALTALETYQARRRQIAMMKAATQNA